MPKKAAKMTTKGMHAMKGGKMMPNSFMPWMTKKPKGKKRGKK